MEPTDVTVSILRDIREEIRGLREEQRGFREELGQFREVTLARFEVIETTLRDLAEQLVLLARAVKVAIESRDKAEQRFEAIEARLASLERPG